MKMSQRNLVKIQKQTQANSTRERELSDRCQRALSGRRVDMGRFAPVLSLNLCHYLSLSGLSQEVDLARVRRILFVLIRVISWIVFVFPPNRNDPRTYTKKHEAHYHSYEL